MRIAIFKFVDTKIEKTPALALKRLLEEIVYPKWHIYPMWQEFRSRYLWTIDVNDVFAANLFGLKQLYERHQTIHKQYLEMQESKYIFTFETTLTIETLFKVCFGYCKMTIQDEQVHWAKHYKLEFVEFLECIGRVAVAYWDQNRGRLEEVSLAKKIEFVLD